MAKTMTASMTKGQVNVVVKQFRDALRKHRTQISKDAAQQANGLENLGMRVFTVYRWLAEKYSDMIIRPVTVDTTLSPEEVLAKIVATGRKPYVTTDVLKSMPRGKSGEREVIFLKLDLSKCGGYISHDDREKEVNALGFDLASPYKVARANIDDSAFADDHRNSTQWKDENGNWCYIAFSRRNDERRVIVRRGDDDWNDGWWVGVVRKVGSVT